MSFNWTMLFREGSWLEFRDYALNQRKNVQARFDTIQYELRRIGSVSITYARSNPDELSSKMTERRLGVTIKTGTTLAKLMRAYVARGGNFFDISMFLEPDSYTIIDENSEPILGLDPEFRGFFETQPYKGVLSPASGDVISDKIDLTGVLDYWKDPVRKLGGKETIWEADSTKFTGDRVIAARSWITQEIREHKHELEARILKLCDLREQLLLERREIILSAIAGTTASTVYDKDSFLEGYHLSNIVYVFDTEFYELKEDGTADFTKPKEGKGSKSLPNLLEDASNGEEKHTAL
jgi:hypothetical protein